MVRTCKHVCSELDFFHLERRVGVWEGGDSSRITRHRSRQHVLCYESFPKFGPKLRDTSGKLYKLSKQTLNTKRSLQFTLLSYTRPSNFRLQPLTEKAST